MSMTEQFDAAVENVKGLTKRPTNEELLQLYALYKQATSGDVGGKRPGIFDVKGRAKYDAWSNLKGTGKEEAGQQYIGLVDKLLASYK